jgi:diguanylate cyclase (GGDEF)-like protein
MSSPVITADLDTPLINIVKEMNIRGIQRVVITDHNGKAVGVITSRDLMRNVEIDYNDFLERKLKYSKEVLNLLPEMLIEVIDTGENHLVVWANEKALGRFGNGIIDKDVTEFIPAETWLKIYADLSQNGKVEDVRFKKDNAIYEFSGFYLRLERTAERGRVQLILRDITEEVMLATTDTLTSIFNRRYMNEFLSKEVERGKRRNAGFAVAIADVDDFKKVNDTYGHPAGDFVLQKIVENMLENLRKYDIIGRYGGEEFLIIMPEIDKENSLLVAERMRQAISAKEIELPNGRRLTVTISLGLAVFDEDGDSPDDLLLKADERLYKAKRAGKNRSVNF